MTGQRQARRRLFLALYPSSEQRQQLVRVVERHCPELAAAAVRPVPEANLHVTLVFLGGVTATTQACVERVAAAVVAPAFAIRLDRLGYWPQRHMLWAMPDPMCLPAALTSLVASLQQGLNDCDVTLGQRPYRPHVTLARQLGRGRALARLNPWTGHSIVFP